MNNTRHSYYPTYASLRLLADQISKENGHLLSSMVARRIKSGDAWRFKDFLLYKTTKSSEGIASHDYRECLASSPITAITEAYILHLLSQDPAFESHPNLYSYLWPKSLRAGSSYRFFVQGYNDRNTEIALALAKPGAVAVITDVQGYYPSINQKEILEKLQRKLKVAQSLDQATKEGIAHFYSQLLSASTGGVPIGPASGHLLGSLALSNLDVSLQKKFGNQYFRYVDDIVVVCDSVHADDVRRFVCQAINNESFKVNADKTIQLDAAQWFKYVARPDIDSSETFWELSKDLALYFAFSPSKADSLQKAFKEEGLSIPVNRILSLSSCNRFRYYWSNKTSKASAWHKISVFLSPEKSLVNRALHLKKMQRQSLTWLLDEPRESDPNLRRWQVQRIRRVVNGLFYLLSFNEWTQSAQIFEQVPELIEQAALASALSSGSVDAILPFFGRGPAAFSELWSEHGTQTPFLGGLPKVPDSATLDSLVSLRLQGLVSLGTEPMLELEEQSRLLKAAGPLSPQERSMPDLSYEDEFESIRLGRSGSDISELLKTRYSSRESTPLEAFSLSSSEYRS